MKAKKGKGVVHNVRPLRTMPVPGYLVLVCSGRAVNGLTVVAEDTPTTCGHCRNKSDRGEART